MKIAFISDIHGNATALDAVLKDIKQRDIDEVFVLGDICFRGLEPQTSLDMVRTLNSNVIKGNADEWVVRGIEDDEVPEIVYEIMNEERNWTIKKLEVDSIDYLKNLPTELNLKFAGIKIHAFHATPTNLFDIVQSDESDEILAGKLILNEADIFIYGHIHKPYVRFVDGKCIINIGSVGLPFDGLNKSSYAIVEIEGDNVEASIVRTSYDVNKVVKQFKDSDYPNKELMTHLIRKSSV